MDNRFYFGFNTSEERKKRRKTAGRAAGTLSWHHMGLPAYQESYKQSGQTEEVLRRSALSQGMMVQTAFSSET